VTARATILLVTIKTQPGSNETLFASMYIARNDPERLPGRWKA
jgi:hypothetical protein